MRELLADPAVAGLEYDGVFGRTTVGASIVAFHGFDLVVHRWDIAVGAGLDERLTDEELDLVERSADGFGDHLYGEGVCKPALEAPDDAGRQERVLARLGRRTPAKALSGHRAQRYSTSGRPAPAYLDRRTATLGLTEVLGVAARRHPADAELLAELGRRAPGVGIAQQP